MLARRFFRLPSPYISSLSSPSSSYLTPHHNVNYQISRGKKLYRGQPQEEIDALPKYEFVPSKPKSKNAYRQDVYAWGFSASGALGNEEYMAANRDEDGGILHPKKAMKKDPKRIKFAGSPDVTIYDAAAGAGFTLLAATVAKTPYLLFGCGLNTDSQLGRQDAGLDKPLLCVANVVPISLPIETDGKNAIKTQRGDTNMEKVLRVAAGRSHSVCLTNTGKVFTLGNNSFGQCGRTIVPQEQYFASRKVHELKIKDADRIVDIVCGQDHTLLLDNSGAVYACGWGTDGQLGNAVLDSNSKVTRVQGDILGEKIVAISSACDTILAINDKGQVFGWGNSEYGQLSSVTRDTQVSVSRALNLEAQVGKVVSVAAGGSMCALVNDCGRVFVWGYGILGLGPQVRECSTPTALPEGLFGKSIFRSEAPVRQVHAGLNHFAAITDRGELYMWGRNNKANLGIGTEVDMSFPYRVSMASAVRKVSLGVDHTVAVTRSFI